MRRTLARTFMLAFVATAAYAFNGTRVIRRKVHKYRNTTPRFTRGGQ
jgi:hypothetical protein